MDNFKLPDCYSGLTDETREALAALGEALYGVWQDILDVAIQAIGAFGDTLDSLAEMVEEVCKFHSRKKPLRPCVKIQYPPNILFDKRARIYRCRNNC